MLQFDDRCSLDLANFEDCSNKIMDSLKISRKTITGEVDKSFEMSDNPTLKTFSEQKYNNSILYYPSVVINSMIYRDNL